MDKVKCHAYRNTKLCTKDCLCLFVCPTGATNNETGQIDFSKCIGCGVCALSCPSRAITMIPNEMPKIQPKDKNVVDQLFINTNNKIKEIRILKYLLTKATNEEEKKLIKALLHSNRVIIEDLMREAEFMIPQSKKSYALLKLLSKDGQVKDKVNRLLDNIKFNIENKN